MSECFNGEELEKQVFSKYCQCSEMDYECDVGYVRTDDGRCVEQEDDKNQDKLDEAEQCNKLGFYTIS